MRKSALALAAMFLTAAGGVAVFAPAPAAARPADARQEARNRALVLELHERFFVKHEVAAVEELVAPGYIQHNPYLPNGRDALIAFFKGLFASSPGASSRVLRSAAEGDLVWLHILAKAAPDDPGQIVVDIFRVEDGKVVEHWDVAQPVPEQTASGNLPY